MYNTTTTYTDIITVQYNHHLPKTSSLCTIQPPLTTDIITVYNTTTTYQRHHHCVQYNHHLPQASSLCTTQPPLTTDIITVYNTTTTYQRHHHCVQYNHHLPKTSSQCPTVSEPQQPHRRCSHDRPAWPPIAGTELHAFHPFPKCQVVGGNCATGGWPLDPAAAPCRSWHRNLQQTTVSLGMVTALQPFMASKSAMDQQSQPSNPSRQASLQQTNSHSPPILHDKQVCNRPTVTALQSFTTSKSATDQQSQPSNPARQASLQWTNSHSPPILHGKQVCNRPSHSPPILHGKQVCNGPSHSSPILHSKQVCNGPTVRALQSFMASKCAMDQQSEPSNPSQQARLQPKGLVTVNEKEEKGKKEGRIKVCPEDYIQKEYTVFCRLEFDSYESHYC